MIRHSNGYRDIHRITSSNSEIEKQTQLRWIDTGAESFHRVQIQLPNTDTDKETEDVTDLRELIQNRKCIRKIFIARETVKET